MEQIVLLIIFAVISLFFNRAKNAQQKEQQKRPTQQRQRPVEQQRSRPVEARTKETNQERPKSFSEAAGMLMQTLKEELQTDHTPAQTKKAVQEKVEKLSQDERTERLKEKLAANKKRLEKMPDSSIENHGIMMSGTSNSESSGTKDMKLHFTKDDVVKGVIMSEILGPPRALKRHSRPSYRKYS